MSDELFPVLNDPKEIAEKATEELEGKCRFILTGTDMGVDVLSDILVAFCHFGCFLENDYDRAQHNVGVNILSRCGVFAPGNMQNVVRSLVNAISQQPKEGGK